MTAHNELGGESLASLSFTVVPITIPTGMTAPTRVTHTLDSITLQWTTPTANGDSEIIRYELFAKADFEIDFKEVYAGMALQTEIKNLLTGFYYQFRVRSVNSLGPSLFSSSSDAILTALVPQMPTELTLVSRSSSEILIKW